MTELNQKVEQYDLREHVIFLGRRNDIPDLLKMIDILIIPSAFEGFPLAGLAAAAGVPVIACDVAGAEEFIRVSGDGVTFAEDDVDSAIKAVKSVMREFGMYSNSGVEFTKKVSHSEYSEKIGDLFDRVISTR